MFSLFQLQTLMNLYGIETEGELLSGCFLKLHSRLGREKVEIADIVRQILAKIRENFRKKFFDEFDLADDDRGADENVSEEMQQKASAWYYVAYSPKNVTVIENAPVDPPQTQFLSFPWLVDDIMLSIRLRKAIQVQESKSVVTSISESVFKVFEHERDMLLQGFDERMRKKNIISQAIPAGEALALFGSSATLLFRPDSDLDLCVLSRAVIAQRGELERDAQIHILQNILPVMRKLFKHARLVESARVPVSIWCLHPYSGQFTLCARFEMGIICVSLL